MMRVTKQPEPRPPGFDFDREVRQRGLRALAALTGRPTTIGRRRPRIQKQADRIEDLTAKTLHGYDYWTRALDALHEAYRGICAYSCFYIEEIQGPTVDHFVALKGAPHQAYEWENYRLACSLMNTRKNAFSDVLDPVLIEDDWFELNLGTLEVQPGESLDPALRNRVQETIDRLQLNSRECTSMRRRWSEVYLQPKEPTRPVPLWYLEERAPFLARELRRQKQLRPEDAAVVPTR